MWYAAVTQSFFSLSTGFGALITYSSYNDFQHNSYRDALIISIADTLTSLLAGFVIFSILGNLAFELQVPVKDVVDSGPGLAFVSYPSALAKFDFLPQLFSLLFFLMLVTLGLGSATGLTSGIIAVVCDVNPRWNKTFVTGIICLIGFGVGLFYVTPGGQAILGLVDFFGGGFIIFFLAMVEAIGVAWIYGLKKFIGDIKFMLNISIGIYWKFCWGFFTPLALFGIFVYSVATYTPLTYQGQLYPAEYEYAGYALILLAIAQVDTLREKNLRDRVLESSSVSYLALSKANKYRNTRSLGALRAPSSSSRPFGPLDLSFAPFGRSGQVTHASYIDYIRCM